MKKFDIKNPIETQNGETIWAHTGMSLTIKDNGKMSVFDARTGAHYQCVERKPRNPNDDISQEQNANTGQNNGYSNAVPQGNGGFDEDIPL